MKSFAKLSLLLALVITGRYLRPATSSALAPAFGAAAALPKPDTLRFASYTATPVSDVAPVSQRTSLSKPQTGAEPTVWF